MSFRSLEKLNPVDSCQIHLCFFRKHRNSPTQEIGEPIAELNKTKEFSEHGKQKGVARGLAKAQG